VCKTHRSALRACMRRSCEGETGGLARSGATCLSPVSPPPGRRRERGQAPRRLGASPHSLGHSRFRKPFQDASQRSTAAR
jgi:hypothetical protein